MLTADVCSRHMEASNEKKPSWPFFALGDKAFCNKDVPFLTIRTY